MAQQPNDLRDRLLATLPQPENLATYREETATLLAKHARAIRWARFEGVLFGWLAIAFSMLWLQSHWHFDMGIIIRCQLISAFMALSAAVSGIRYYVYSSQIATFKELKQVQLQILELQASLQKNQ